MTTSINQVIQRHLSQLKKEVTAYANESDLWLAEGEIANPAGNLCLHLCGNLQHFIGAVLGNTGYQRQRDYEFTAKNVPVTELVAGIEATMKAVETTLKNLDPGRLEETYPVRVFNEPMTTGFFLVHLAGHLGYHLGQVNYHRRLLAG